MERYVKKCMLLLVPSLLGTAVFYVLPYLRVIYYSLIENQFTKRFAGLDNYIRLLKNEYFRLALKNSMLLILIAVPAMTALAFAIAVLLTRQTGGWRLLRAAFFFPMLVPTASVAAVWRMLFEGNESVVPVYLLFLYKNIGLMVILFSAAFSTLPREALEAARLEGAHGFRLHLWITLPLICPTLLFVVLLGIVYSFRIFRESYQYFGTNYPPEHSYTLQYYMNNHFYKLNYQYLASGAVLTSLLIFAIVAVGIRLQRRVAL